MYKRFDFLTDLPLNDYIKTFTPTFIMDALTIQKLHLDDADGNQIVLHVDNDDFSGVIVFRAIHFSGDQTHTIVDCHLSSKKFKLFSKRLLSTIMHQVYSELNVIY